MPRLRNVLVANRGEIAVRVLRTLRQHGYQSTAVYSDADAAAPHVALADRALRLGPAPAAQSYLDISRVLAAARLSAADAVHPGYGFLAENAELARACQDAGLVFIGPPAEVIRLMGDKRRARQAMARAGIACVPGYDAEDQGEAALLAAAERIGFPIMVKAAASGGGRGMRRIERAEELPEALSRARSEAEKGFGSGQLLLERALDGVRHVEVQIAADAHGHVVALGERDCSVQRRFQKVVEEAPSPVVTPELRRRLCDTAVRVAQHAGYLGIGTVELLLSAAGEWFFLEMNTRIQVEHPVTELLTGLDLVALQLTIAQGEALPAEVRAISEALCTSGQLPAFGHAATAHAIEARLCAEDPAQGLLPVTGRILRCELPEAAGVRVDHALHDGQVIGPDYDSLLAKVIAVGADREQARERLLRALRSCRIAGIPTNRDFLIAVLEHPSFAAGRATTDFIGRELSPTAPAAPTVEALAIAACLFTERAQQGGTQPYAAELSGFVAARGIRWPMRLQLTDGQIGQLDQLDPVDLHVSATSTARSYVIDLEERRLTVTRIAPDACVVDGMRLPCAHVWEPHDEPVLWLHTQASSHRLRDVTHAPPDAVVEVGSGRALAPMDGAVVAVAVALGERVRRGQTLAVIEAMKLELRVTSQLDGRVQAVHVAQGAQVKARQVLVEVAAEPPDAAQ